MQIKAFTFNTSGPIAGSEHSGSCPGESVAGCRRGLLQGENSLLQRGTECWDGSESSEGTNTHLTNPEAQLRKAAQILWQRFPGWNMAA